MEQSAAKLARAACERAVSQAAMLSGEDNLARAEALALLGAWPLALPHARRAAATLPADRADARCLLGELCLEAGLVAEALAIFEEAHAAEREARRSIRAAVGRAAALCARAPADDADAVSAAVGACEGAIKAFNSPLTQKYELAQAKLLLRALDDALQVSSEVCGAGGRPLKAGESLYGRAVELGAAVEAACYAEATWPALAAVRPERATERKGLPAGTEPAAWWLSRARDRLRTYLKKETAAAFAARARARLAELSLETRLYEGLVAPQRVELRTAGAATGGDGGCAMEADEIQAVMSHMGVAAQKQSDPSEALRALEAKRLEVLAAGGASAAQEADELARLHEWQMRQLGGKARAAPTAAAARGAAGGAAAAGGGGAALEQYALDALSAADEALGATDEARYAPHALLSKGRALLALGRPTDALAPLAAARALLAADAPWRGAGAPAAAPSAPSHAGIHAAAARAPAAAAWRAAAAQGWVASDYDGVGFALGVASLEAGRGLAQAAPAMAAALARVRAALPPTPSDWAAAVRAGPPLPPADPPDLNLRLPPPLIVRCVCSPLCPELPHGARLLAAAHAAAGQLEAACDACALGHACALVLLAALGTGREGARAPALRAALEAEHAELRLLWARCLARVGEEAAARDAAADLAAELRASALIRSARAAALRGGGARERAAVVLWVRAARLRAGLEPSRAAAHEDLGDALLALFDLNPAADATKPAAAATTPAPAPPPPPAAAAAAAADDVGAIDGAADDTDADLVGAAWSERALMREARVAFARAIELDGQPCCALRSTRRTFVAAPRVEARTSAQAAAAVPQASALPALAGKTATATAAAAGGARKPAASGGGGSPKPATGAAAKPAPAAAKITAAKPAAAKPPTAALAKAPARPAAKPAASAAKPTSTTPAVATSPKSAVGAKPASTPKPAVAALKPAAASPLAAKAAPKPAGASPPAASSQATTISVKARLEVPAIATRRASQIGTDDAPSPEQSAAPAAAVAAAQHAAEPAASPVAFETETEASAAVEAAAVAEVDLAMESTSAELLRAVAAARAARATEVAPPGTGELNVPTAGARLGLVRASRELGEPRAAMRPVLEGALALGGRARYDLTLYEELSGLLARGVQPTEPLRAVEVLCSFPFSDVAAPPASADAADETAAEAAPARPADAPPADAFGENALRLAAMRLLLQEKQWDDARLEPLIVAVGKCLGGVQHVEKSIDALDGAGRTDACKRIYCGITGLSEEEQRASFQARGWAEAYSSAAFVAAPLGRRKFI